jgi:hypothetical protein
MMFLKKLSPDAATVLALLAGTELEHIMGMGQRVKKFCR